MSLTGKFDIFTNNTSHKDKRLSQEPETEKLYNEYINLKPNFNYDKIHDFHTLISRINVRKTFSIFHSNICSLPANNENLEILLEDLSINLMLSLSVRHGILRENNKILLRKT